MKILYLSNSDRCDYMRDMLCHGLRTLLGPDLVDAVKIETLYQSFPKVKELYGKGFTLYGLLPEIAIDRTEIDTKIRSKYFDLVIFSSVPRFNDNHELFFLLGVVLESYPRNQIIFIDGADDPDLYRDLMKAGIYFKRERKNPVPESFSIQFAIPEEKIAPPEQMKDFLLAPLNQWDPRTYIYEDEQSYYRDYRRSLFGRTSRKCGWDCLRHYEIMACNAIPYFENIEECPETLMMNLPKKELILAKQLFEYREGAIFRTRYGMDLWQNLMGIIATNLRENLTTVALAKRILDTVHQVQAKTVEMVTA